MALKHARRARGSADRPGRDGGPRRLLSRAAASRSCRPRTSTSEPGSARGRSSTRMRSSAPARRSASACTSRRRPRSAACSSRSGELPVIVEDDVLVGGNCGIYEGAIVRERAVLASGVILTGGTPVYDLVRGAEYRGDRAARSRFPPAPSSCRARAPSREGAGRSGDSRSRRPSSSSTATGRRTRRPRSRSSSCAEDRDRDRVTIGDRE